VADHLVFPGGFSSGMASTPTGAGEALSLDAGDGGGSGPGTAGAALSLAAGDVDGSESGAAVSSASPLALSEPDFAFVSMLFETEAAASAPQADSVPRFDWNTRNIARSPQKRAT